MSGVEPAPSAPQGWAEALLDAEEPILAMIGGGRPLPEVLDAFCRLIESLCAGAACSVLLLDTDGRALRWAANPSLPPAYRDAAEPVPVGPGCGSCGTAAHAGEVVISADIATDPHWARCRDAPLSVGLRACWSVPIRSSAGGVLGTFGTFLPEPRRPAAHELRLCRRVAHLAAGAIERARSESRYRRIVETANEGIWTLDADQRTTFVNARMAEMLGDSVAELIGRSAWDFAFEEDRPEGRRRWERLQAGEAGRSEVRLRRRDGSGLWVHSSTGPIHDSDGRFAGALGMFADITGRKEAEEALKESERRFRQMAETIREVFWMTDPGKGQLLYVSPAYEEVWGRPCRSLYEQPFSFFEAIHPEDRERVRAASLERQNRGDPSDVEYRVVRPDGSVRWVRDRSFPVRDESGTVDRVAGLAEDITERKLAGDALRRSEARLRRVVESNVVGLIVADFSGRVLEANDAFLRLTGSSRDQLRSGRLNFLELTPPEHRHLDRRAMEEMRDTGRHAPFEKEYIRKDGSRVPVLVGTSFLGRDRDGGELGVGFIVDLTERKRAEAALRDSEERFRGLMEQAPFSVQVFSPDGRVVRANRAWEELWGVTADRIPEYNILADPQLEAKGVLPLIRRAFLGETVQIPAIRYDPEETLPGRTRHDDPVRWVSAVAYPLKDKDGRVREVVAVHEDMTAWMRAEEALRESESTLRAFYDHSPVCLGVTEPTGDGDVLHVYDNPATCRFFGIEPGTTAGKRALADLGGDPAVVAGWLDCYQRSAATGQPVHFDHEYPTPNGTRWLSATVCPIGPGPSGRPRFCYVAEDVTERRRAEAAVRASEERLRLALGAGRMGTWDWDLSSGCVAWSDNLEEVHGLPPGGFDCTLEGFHRLVHPEDRQRVEAAIRRAIELVSGYEVEFRIVRPDGSAGWMLGLGKVFTDEAGCPARMIGVGMDITLRKQDEERLRASEANAALALGVARLGTWGWDLAGGGVDADARCREICGFDLDATLTLTEVRAAVLPQDWPRVEAALGEALRPGGDGGYAGEFRFAHADESVRWVVSHGRTLFEGQGAARRPVRMVGTVLDITGRKRAEEALREADRRKSEFLATLAHELRNPLAPVRNAARLLADSPAVMAEAGAEVEVIERQVAHLARLVDDLLDVARIERGKIELRRELIELSPVVRHVIEAVRPTAEARRHELIASVPAVPIWLEADPTRLEQVLGNLLANAIKYTEPGGRIALEAGRDGDRAVLRVRDTGIGIPPEKLPYVFEMFAQVDERSTRTQGGLGIGLSLVRSLVEMHGGSVRAHSAGPGRGSEFVVRLPALPAAPPARPVEPGPGQRGPDRASLPRRRILVVDDNIDAANSLTKLLTRIHGQEVRVAHDGPSALEAAGEFRPEVVLLDIGMPGMDGYEVARRLRSRPEFAETLLVALTGWGQQEDRRRARAAGFDHHLVKPVEPEALRGVIAGITRAGPGDDGRSVI